MFYVIDCETTGLSPAKDKLSLVAYANLLDPQENGIFDAIEEPHKVEELLDKAKGFVGYNLAFDINFLDAFFPQKNIKAKPNFCIFQALREIFEQTFSLKHLAFLCFSEAKKMRYLELHNTLEPERFAERPLAPDLLEYTRCDLELTTFLARQFMPYIFIFFDPLFPDLIQRPEGRQELAIDVADALENTLRALFSNETIGNYMLFLRSRQLLQECLPDNEPLPYARIRKTTRTVQKYSLKSLLNHVVGLEMLQSADILLDRKPLEQIAYTEDRQEALRQALTDAWSSVSTHIEFTPPSIVSPNPPSKLLDLQL